MEVIAAFPHIRVHAAAGVRTLLASELVSSEREREMSARVTEGERKSGYRKLNSVEAAVHNNSAGVFYVRNLLKSEIDVNAKYLKFQLLPSALNTLHLR